MWPRPWLRGWEWFWVRVLLICVGKGFLFHGCGPVKVCLVKSESRAKQPWPGGHNDGVHLLETFNEIIYVKPLQQVPAAGKLMTLFESPSFLIYTPQNTWVTLPAIKHPRITFITWKEFLCHWVPRVLTNALKYRQVFPSFLYSLLLLSYNLVLTSLLGGKVPSWSGWFLC